MLAQGGSVNPNNDEVYLDFDQSLKISSTFLDLSENGK